MADPRLFGERKLPPIRQGRLSLIGQPQTIVVPNARKLEALRGYGNVEALKDVARYARENPGKSALGVGKFLGDFALDLVPGVGDVKSGVEAITGKSLMGDLSPTERVLSGLGALPFIPGQIKAFHGSPHKFSKFTTSKMGTGEGQQAFGWGLYFTDKESIARGYSKMRQGGRTGAMARGKGWMYDNQPLISTESTLSNSEKYVLEGVMKTKSLSGAKNKINAMSNRYNKADDVAKYYMGNENPKDVFDRLINSGILRHEKHKGILYETTLHKGKKPDEYDYLRWDKPLSKSQKDKIIRQKYIERGYKIEGNSWLNQKGEKIPNEAVKKQIAVDKELMGREGQYIYGHLGQEFGRKLNQEMGLLNRLGGTDEKGASLFLLRAGIDGIKYPSGTLSGIKGSKNFNYVVFDEAAIDIEKVVR